jgi:GNAT superfamily N-acetyltransferase
VVLREATLADISQMHIVRTCVKENQLSNPDLISFKDYEEYLVNRGKGWVVEANNVLVGFSIVDLIDKNVWALFVHPDYEGQSFGRMLHDKMINWYFTQTEKTIWLSTSPGTRAEKFYEKAGWKQTGLQANGELKFEMTAENWKEKITK